MLRRIIYRLTRKHHTWRDVKFSELTEIYTSMSLRSFGFGVIGIFVPIFLYNNGVNLSDIFYFYTLFFIFRIPVAFIAGYIVARVGPKHSIALSTIITILFLSLLVTYSSMNWSLLLLSLLFTVSNGLFFIAYHTDFSKIKDSKNGGKELGWLYIFERFGSALGPFVGGLLASYVAPEISIVFAMLMLVLSLVPLFLSSEPVKLRQKISYKGFAWKNQTANYLSMGAFHVDNVASMVLWPLFIAVAIFEDDTYAKVGSLVAISMVVSMFSARMYGKFIDDNKGLFILRYGVTMNAFVHAIRSFVVASGGAIAISTLNEPMTLLYKMPLVKGLYDEADSIEGYRIVYFVTTEIFTAFVKFLMCLALLLFSYSYSPVEVLRYSFVFVGIISIGILLQRYKALKNV